MWQRDENDLGEPAWGMLSTEGGAVAEEWWEVGSGAEQAGDCSAGRRGDDQVGRWGTRAHGTFAHPRVWLLCINPASTWGAGSWPGTLCCLHKASLSGHRPCYDPRAMGAPWAPIWVTQRQGQAPPPSTLLSGVAEEKSKWFTPSARALASLPLPSCLNLCSPGEMESNNKNSYQLYPFFWFLLTSI